MFHVQPDRSLLVYCPQNDLTLSLPDIKALDLFTAKVFVDDKSNFAVVSVREENIVGEGESAGYQHFLLFPQCFQNLYSLEMPEIRFHL